MKNIFKFGFYAFACLFFTLFGFLSDARCAQSDIKLDGAGSKSFSTQKGNVTYVPCGITISALLLQDISSATLQSGESVSAVLNQDFKHNATLIAPKGSLLSGMVVESVSANNNTDGQLKIRFTTIRTPQGYNIPISAIVSTSDKSGVIKETGSDVQMNANTEITVYFNQPITLSAPSGY